MTDSKKVTVNKKAVAFVALGLSAAVCLFGVMRYYIYIQEQKSYGGECQHPSKWIDDVDPKYCDL